MSINKTLPGGLWILVTALGSPLEGFVPRSALLGRKRPPPGTPSLRAEHSRSDRTQEPGQGSGWRVGWQECVLLLGTWAAALV